MCSQDSIQDISAFEEVVPGIVYNGAIPLQAVESPSQNAVIPVAPATPVSVPKPVRARGTRRKHVAVKPPQAIGFTHSNPADPAGPPVASPAPNYKQQSNFSPASVASPGPNLQHQLIFGPQHVANPGPGSQQQSNFCPSPVNIQDPQFQLNFGPQSVALDGGFVFLAPPQTVAPHAGLEAVPRQQAMVPAMRFPREAPRPQSEAILLPRNMSQPPVWAHKRQQLCEVLPYYNAYQSGVYMSAGIIHSMMIDGESRPQDIFTNEIIITRW